MFNKKPIVLGLLTACLAGWLRDGRAQTNAASAENNQAFVLGTNGTLLLTLPARWKGTLKEARGTDGLHDAIVFTSSDTNEFNFLIVVFSTTDKHAGDAEMKDSLLQSGERELTNYAETSITLHDLQGSQAAGTYFRVTDRRLTATKPAAGDFKYMTRGYAVLGPLVVTFELVSNDADRDEPAAIEVLRQAHFARADTR
jgi:hypothetical protein